MSNYRNAVVAAAYTALWTFLGLFGASAVGFLTQVAEWASANGGDPFPDTSVLGYAFVSAVAAALAGLVGLVVRLAQAGGLVPGAPPVYPGTDERGSIEPGSLVLGFIAALVLVVVLSRL